MRQIIENFSWDTLMSLPPTELLAFAVIVLIVLAPVIWLVGVFIALLAQ
jgi:hypothetical protein